MASRIVFRTSQKERDSQKLRQQQKNEDLKHSETHVNSVTTCSPMPQPLWKKVSCGPHCATIPVKWHIKGNFTQEIAQLIECQKTTETLCSLGPNGAQSIIAQTEWGKFIEIISLPLYLHNRLINIEVHMN